jgi:hypothetical protein
MIAKHINFKNRAPSSIVRLVEYITADREKAHRIGEIMIANCEQDDPEHAALEMLVTQTQNRRAKSDKTYHLLLSFRPGEEPTPETVRRAEKDVCGKLGFGEHQRIAVVHRDTDSVHMHVAINKIHPTRFVIHDPHLDFKILADACAELEKSLHLREDNHAKTGKTEGERRANDMEAMTGQESLLSWIKRECLPAVREAESWETLHSVLAKAGLKLALRGNGMVIADASGATVKASDVDRAFSKGNLEKRLGIFQTQRDSGDVAPQKSYKKGPLGPATPLKAEFEQVRDARDATRNAKLAEIRDDYRHKAAVVRSRNQDARSKARRIPAGRMAKKRLYLALREQCRRELSRLREESNRQREALRRERPRHTWLSWLQAEAEAGREDALKILRGRAFGLARKAGAAIRGEQTDKRQLFSNDLISSFVDTVTKHGTVIYSVGNDALRDDGESFRVSRDASLDTAILALKVAKQRFGEVLRLDGDTAFRDRMIRAAATGKVSIRFADPQVEAKRKELSHHTIPNTLTRIDYERE